MTWEPTDGTQAIASWLNQGVLFAVVLAVAAVIGCAVVWAAGSLAGNGAAATRGRTGILVALVAALLLGGGYGYLGWISTTQAPAFAGDPAQYGIADTPDIPGVWQFVDLSERWTSSINAVRAKDGLPPYRTDGALTDRARTCAGSRAGQGGECPVNSLGCKAERGMVYGAWDYGPGDLDKLDGDLAEDFIRNPNPWGGESLPVTLDESADMRSAWVALRDDANKRAVVVAMFENGAGLAVWNKCVQFG